MPNRRQDIIRTNADLIHWRIYAALGGDELMLHAPGYLCSNDQCFLRRDIITSQTGESLAYNKDQPKCRVDNIDSQKWVWDLLAKICPKRDCYYFYKDVAYETRDIWIVQCFIKWTFDKKYSRSWLIVPAGLLINRRPLIYTEQLLIPGRLSTSQCKEICLFCFNFVSIFIKTII